MRERLARRGIADFPQYGRAAGARRRGQVRWAAMKRLIRKQRKSESFFAVFGNAQARGRENFDFGKRGCELRQDERIVRAAAGDDKLVNLAPGKDEAVQCIDEGERGE